MNEKWYSLEEALEISSKKISVNSRNTIKQFINGGRKPKLLAVIIGSGEAKRYRIKKEWLDEWIQKMQTPSN